MEETVNRDGRCHSKHLEGGNRVLFQIFLGFGGLGHVETQNIHFKQYNHVNNLNQNLKNNPWYMRSQNPIVEMGNSSFKTSKYFIQVSNCIFHHLRTQVK